MRTTGILVGFLGIALSLMGMFSDASVGTGMGRVANLSLLNEKLAFVVAGGALMIVGAAFYVVSEVIYSVERLGDRLRTEPLSNGPMLARPQTTTAPPPVGAWAAVAPAPPTSRYEKEEWWDAEAAATRKGWKVSITPDGLRAQHTDGTLRTFPTPDAARAFFAPKTALGRATGAEG